MLSDEDLLKEARAEMRRADRWYAASVCDPAAGGTALVRKENRTGVLPAGGASPFTAAPLSRSKPARASRRVCNASDELAIGANCKRRHSCGLLMPA